LNTHFVSIAQLATGHKTLTNSSKIVPKLTTCNVCRFLKWDDAPCDLNSVGGIKVLCEVELR